ncbi:MAG: PQQ-binding-like beta-propeller repeat protein, partial [Acidimicrobiia bacterium]|nr:PQQ-binding-like beta-propeller repeat protein [Acidimicrobiia bacterium]
MTRSAEPRGRRSPNGVPPRPPRWLAVVVALATVAVAGFVARDLRSTEDAATATLTDTDLSALVAAVEDPAGTGAGTAPDDDSVIVDDASPDAPVEAVESESATQEQPPLQFEDRDGVWVDPASSGMPWSALGSVEGLLTFRGNPTRSFHGRGPVPAEPVVQWSATIGCSTSFVGGEPKEWCGTGWTGQPLVFHPPGSTDDWWVAVGGYNRAVNFFDPADGATVYPPFFTGDIIKGTATVDPDGFPLLYTGSRDDSLHVVALDRNEPVELWSLAADVGGRTLWNNDWDGSSMVIDDLLIVGGENSRFYVVKLNRGYDADGLVTIDPELLSSVEGWDDQLLSDVGDVQVSIENSVAVSGSVVYFANSGGLVQGWDLAGVAEGGSPERVFRFWAGDDIDASVVVDGDGQLYVGAEYERGTARSRELGQVLRLDPSKPDDPLVWSVEANAGLDTGVWATPALYEDLVLVPTDDGRVLGLDRADG